MAFDIILFLLAALGFLAGYKRGIIYMVFFLIALFFGVFASLKFNTILSDFLLNNFNIDGPFMPLLSLIITFVIVFSAIVWLSELLTKALKLILLNSFNRLFGGLLGAIAGAALVSIAAWYINGLSLIPESIINKSNTIGYSLSFAPFIIDKIGGLLPFMSNLFEQLEILFEQQTKETV